MNISKRDRTVLAALAAVAVIGGTYWYGIKPAQAQVDQRRSELSTIQNNSDMIRDQISRLQKAAAGGAERTVESFRLAKAMPDQANVVAAMVQLQKVARASNIQLGVMRTSAVSTLGSLTVVELEVDITGKYFDVDDFMYRVHHMVSVNAKGDLSVGGRLFAFKSITLDLAQAATGSSGSDNVSGILHTMVFAAPSTSGASATTATGATASATTATTGGTQ
ncbi:MAG: type II secretion system protein GspM [Thermoleophilia bacterium]